MKEAESYEGNCDVQAVPAAVLGGVEGARGAHGVGVARGDRREARECEAVAEQLDVGVESLRTWVKQHEIDHGERPGTTTADAERIKLLVPLA